MKSAIGRICAIGALVGVLGVGCVGGVPMVGTARAVAGAVTQPRAGDTTTVDALVLVAGASYSVLNTDDGRTYELLDLSDADKRALDELNQRPIRARILIVSRGSGGYTARLLEMTAIDR